MKPFGPGSRSRAQTALLSTEDFRASDGWIDKWKQRNNVTLQAVSKEENAVTPEMTASWNEAYLPTTLTKYNLKDIYNANDLGLFYQALPEKSLRYEVECCSGGKNSKVRLTGLAGGNAMGEKIPIIEIRNCAKTCCFSALKSLQCRYRAQKHS